MPQINGNNNYKYKYKYTQIPSK